MITDPMPEPLPAPTSAPVNPYLPELSLAFVTEERAVRYSDNLSRAASTPTGALYADVITISYERRVFVSKLVLDDSRRLVADVVTPEPTPWAWNRVEVRGQRWECDQFGYHDGDETDPYTGRPVQILNDRPGRWGASSHGYRPSRDGGLASAPDWLRDLVARHAA